MTGYWYFVLKNATVQSETTLNTSSFFHVAGRQLMGTCFPYTIRHSFSSLEMLFLKHMDAITESKQEQDKHATVPKTCNSTQHLQ